MGLGPSVRAAFWEGPRDTVPRTWLRVLLASGRVSAKGSPRGWYKGLPVLLWGLGGSAHRNLIAQLHLGLLSSLML